MKPNGHKTINVVTPLVGVMPRVSCHVITLLDIVKDSWHALLLLALVALIAAHAILAIIIDDEIQFLVGKTVMLC